MILTLQQLSKCIDNPKLDEWLSELNSSLPKFQINTAARVSGFLAQCGHESNDFKALSENLNYSQSGLRKVFGKYFPNDAIAYRYARQPAAIANRVYGGRMGNGGEASGDGYKFRGRGILQITGRSNYTKCSQALFNDDTLVKNPDLLTTPKYAVLTACWFWDSNKLNDICDKKDIVLLSKRVNGGVVGLDDRIKRWNTALDILS